MIMLDKQQLIEELKKYESIITSQSNDKAVKVRIYYRMWYNCPGDNMSFVLCEAAFQEWLADYTACNNGDYQI